MKSIDGARSASENASDLASLTRLMKLSSELSAIGEALCATKEASRGTLLMDLANSVTEEVGVWAERTGHTMDDVVTPLWSTEATPQA